MSAPSSHPAAGRDRPVIVWDGMGLSAENSGVGVYGRQLYSALSELGCFPSVAAFSDATPSFVAEDHQIRIDRSHNKIIGRLERMKPFHPLSTYNVCKSKFKNERIIFHGLSNINLPVFLSKRPGDHFVLTIHDLIPLNLEEITPLAAQMMALLPRVISRADKIITPSYWTKIQILERYGAELSQKITNVGNGTMSPTIAGKPWQARTIDGLTISRGESYKRLDVVAKIAAKMPTRSFVVVTNDRGAQTLRQRPANLTLLQNVSQAELDELYANAKVLLHPSLYEGWCFPAADALSRGLLLLYCIGSGIDEVAGFARRLSKGLKPESTIDDWVGAFESLVSKDSPNAEPPRLPSWLEIAQKTLKIYDSLL